MIFGKDFMKSTKESYDLVILGSGSTAFAAALQAAELGKTAIMTEVRTVGGTCANRGCLPSKNLIEAARLVYDAAHPRYPGLTPTHLPFNFADLIAQKDEIIKSYRTQKYVNILDDAEDIHLISGKATLISDHEVEVHNPDGIHHLAGEHILIATGSIPTIPDLPGLADTPYLTSDLLSSADDPWGTELCELPRSLIILGGGYIALELGQMFARFGTKVTLVTRGTSILTGYEPEITAALTEILRDEGLHIITGAQAQSICRDGNGIAMVIQKHGNNRKLTAERLLVATGRRPNTQDISLDKAGIAVDNQGAVQVDQHLRTNVTNIWAAGDVIGSQMATPVGARDGKIAAHNALSGEPLRTVDHSIIPRAVFTDPQVAVVGLTDEEAVAAGIVCECNTIPMSVVPRAGAIRDTRGVIKMILDRESRRVHGVSMLGTNAAEVIHEAAMAMRFGATVMTSLI
jgi:mercuric reductase